MDNDKLIAELKNCCRPPEPERKTEFFQMLAEQRPMEQSLKEKRSATQGPVYSRRFVMNHGEFLLGQMLYIRKRSWVLSGIILLFIMGICCNNSGHYPFALTPLLAAGVLVETERSFRFKMAELEHAARFSLKSIVLARMFLMGAVDTAGLLAAICVVRPLLPYSLIRTFLYMMVPYLAASLAGSVYERKNRADHDWGVIAICILTSALFAAAPVFYSRLYEERLTVVWAAAFIVLIGSLAAGMAGWARELEEPAWSL